jgi:hypothetical protein
MELAILVVLGLRLLIPLTIIRWPFWGTIASMLIDSVDVAILHAFGVPAPLKYPEYDKILDSYYLTFAFFKSLQWKGLEKKTSIVLYAWRMIGVLVFEISHIRWILFLAPNIFEFWFLFWSARNKWFKHFELTKKRLAIILVVILIPKLFHEYVLHVARWCDKPYFNYCGIEKIFCR